MIRSLAGERTAEANGAEPKMLNYVPNSLEGVTDAEQIETYQYYRQANRWQHENSPNRFLKASTYKTFAFDAFSGVDTLLTQPILLVAGSNAGTKWHSDRAYELAKGEKELFVVPGATHMSLYDRDVSKSMPKPLEFFGKHLNHPAS
jgi:uncharacterized protein